MRLKDVLPWICVLGLLSALGALYLVSQKQAAELAQLRQESQPTASEPATNNAPEAESDELTRLRKENEDLLRLRNEVGRLRSENQQLTRQLQTAQVQVQSVEAQAKKAQEQAQALAVKAPPALTPAQQALASRYGQAVSPEQAQLNTCLNNLRQIEAAKQSWALANNRPRGGLVGQNDIAGYFGTNFPACPAGGVYTLNPIGINPICSIPSHRL